MQLNAECLPEVRGHTLHREGNDHVAERRGDEHKDMMIE